MDLLASLNDKQAEAVQSLDGFFRVIAGAGSGKTKTLTHRFAWLVREIGIPSNRILCVTFTNKAANEMKDRIVGLLDGDMDLNMQFVCTFHSFCVKVLRKEIPLLGLHSDFKILDVEDQKLLMKEMYKRQNISTKDYPIDDVLHKVDKLKGGDEWMNSVLVLLGRGQMLIEPMMDESTKIAIRYLSFQREMGGLDFNDLITFTTYLFREYPEARKRWSSRFDYIMVDETQDNSILQWLLLDYLSEVHKNLYVVGDPDQAIYSFRGAKPDFLVSLDQKYSCKTIVLDQNYRSTPVILNAANNVIANNRNRVKKDLFTKNDVKGSLIDWYHAEDTDDESIFVAHTVQRLLNEKTDPKEIAVLFRISALSRSIEQAFIKAGIPYQVFGGTRFFERLEIKDSLAFLSLLVNDDDVSFLRVVNKPARQLGDAFLAELSRIANEKGTHLYPTLRDNLGSTKMLSKPSAKKFVALVEQYRAKVGTQTISTLLNDLLVDIGYMDFLRNKEEEERLDNIMELIGSIKQYEDGYSADSIVSINQYLQDISLYTNMDVEDDDESVKLMTIHQSKGLEFSNVFLIGFNESVLPSFRALSDINPKKAIEEERRLAYVAITRAKSHLYLSDVAWSFRGDQASSRFLGEIDPVYVHQVQPVPAHVIQEMNRLVCNPRFGSQRRVFPVGFRFRDSEYGVGQIVDVNKEEEFYVMVFKRNPDELVEILFDDFDMKYLPTYDKRSWPEPTVGSQRFVGRYGICTVLSVNNIEETFVIQDSSGNVRECNWEG